MDLSLLKQKLDGLQQKSNSSGQKTDYTTIFWRPTVGKQQVRIVPSAYNSSNPFKELKFYYGITNKVMISPLNFGEKDPIYLFAQKLREEYNKENYILAKKLDAKTRIFAPVIVRGEEDKGVRFWEFGKMVYQELLGVMMDEDYGDITDIAQGRDVTVEVIPAAETGKMYDTTTVRVKPVQTPLSDSAETIESFLENQKNVVELFNKYSFDEMKESLQKYLAPSEEQETVEATTPAKEKVDLDSKIDDLFG